MTEQWRTVPGYSMYEVSDLGRVRSYRNGKWGQRTTPQLMAGSVWGRPGYRRFVLRADGSGARRGVRAHALVLLAFVGPRPAGMVTRHLNGDASDNRLANLIYGTYSENGLDAVGHGDNPRANQTACSRGHEYAGDNLIWDSVRRRRQCRACREINNRNSSARRAERRRAAREKVA